MRAEPSCKVSDYKVAKIPRKEPLDACSTGITELHVLYFTKVFTVHCRAEMCYDIPSLPLPPVGQAFELVGGVRPRPVPRVGVLQWYPSLKD